MTIEVALAVGLFSALLAVLHSIQVERSELLAASASTNFRMVISVEADAPSGLPISPEQLGRVQETFGDKATHWGPTASQVRLSDGTPAFFGRGERIHVRYSSAVPAGSFYASGRAEELLLSDDYTSTGLPTETLEELRSRIAAGHLHKMTSPAPQPLDEPLDELIERHLEPLRMLGAATAISIRRRSRKKTSYCCPCPSPTASAARPPTCSRSSSLRRNTPDPRSSRRFRSCRLC